MAEPLRLIVDSQDKWPIAQEYISSVNRHRRFAIDTETCGRDGVPNDLKPALRLDSIMLGLSISKDRDSGIFIPWFNAPSKTSIWTPAFRKSMREWLFNEWFAKWDVGWVFHNAIFDLLVLKRHIGRPRNVVFDTQIAAHELNENRSIRLKDLGESMYGMNAKEEKIAMMTWAHEHPEAFGTSKPSDEAVMGQLYKLPLELYGTYAIKDTMLTYALYEDFGKELAAQGMVQRYKWKNSLIPIYEEINSTGWSIDEQILLESGEKMYEEVSELFTTMHNALEAEIASVEKDILDKADPIAATPTWKKRLIHKEGLEQYFTVPPFKTNRKGEQIPNKDAGKLTLSKEMVTTFWLCGVHNTLTEEFLKWDGNSVESLSPELRSELDIMRKAEYIVDRIEKAKADGKIPCPWVFNFGSDQQLCDLLFVKLNLPVGARTGKSNAPDMSEDALSTMKASLLRDNGNQPTRITTFIEALLKFRELEKLYGTYVVGIHKRLYSAADLGRRLEVNPATGNVLKYCISHVNMTGTVTGRPSSSDPNQLNFPKDDRIKKAFIAPEGYMLGSADYDAQEVRQAVNIAMDKDMKEVFTVICESCKTPQTETLRNIISLDVYKERAPKYDKSKTEVDDKGKPKLILVKEADPSICCPVCKAFNWSEPDPHSLTAKRTFPECKTLSLKDIKKQFKDTRRQQAKTVTFQTLYGGTESALSASLKITREEAKGIQQAFFAGAPSIKRAIDKVIAEARERGYVETIGGYRRHLPDLAIEEGKYMKWPELDPETATWKCFAKVDHHPEIDANGRAHKMSNMDCPRKGKCQYLKSCDEGFKRGMAKKLKARAERQAFNVQIQGDSADITNKALMNIALKRIELAKKNPIWNKVKIVANIYDAVYLLVPNELCPKDPINDPEEVNYIKVLKWAMENTYPDLFVPLTAGLEAPAHSWADCH